MCDTCGCGGNHEHEAEFSKIEALNARFALHNRRHFQAMGAFAVNLMAAPGSGKTTLLEHTLARLKEQGRMAAVLVGDLATDLDALRLKKFGYPVQSIATGMACHLNAEMVARALHALPKRQFDFLFIENVGNLVCPAGLDLGEDAKAVLWSTPEGEDKPCKYPQMFLCANLVAISKSELAPFLGFDLHAAQEKLRRLGVSGPILSLSAKTGEDMEAWFSWLEEALAAKGRTALLASEGHGAS